jgi:hypothetical protein
MGVTSGIEWMGDGGELVIFYYTINFCTFPKMDTAFLPQNKTPLLREARRAFFAPLNVGVSLLSKSDLPALERPKRASYAMRFYSVLSLW